MYLRDISFPRKPFRTLIENGGYEGGWPNLEICCSRSGQLTVNKTPIKPFRLLKPHRLPEALRKKFQLEWKPIFAMMEEAPDLMIPAGMSPLSPEFIQESFDKGTAYLKSRASYIWALRKSKIEAWSIGEWSKHVKYSAIMKNGMESDKAKLPAATRYNEAHRRPRKRRRKTVVQGN
jgi:hypothetical protein